MNKKVTIIIPTYKGEDYLGRAIQTVLDQSYTNYELIVVDDNGKNTHHQLETQKVIDSFKDDRVKYIVHEKNKNGAAARNTGLKIAEGKYICFLDDDDLLLENRIKNAVEYLESNREYDAVFSDVACSDENLSVTRIVHVSKKGNCTNEILLDDMFFGTGSNIFITKKAADEIGYFDEKFVRHQDLEYMIRFYRKFKSGTTGKIDIIKSKNSINNIPNYEKLQKNEDLYNSTFKKEIDQLGDEKQKAYFEKQNLMLRISKICSSPISIDNIKDFAKVPTVNKIIIATNKTGISKFKSFEKANSCIKKRKYRSMKGELPKHLVAFIEKNKKKAYRPALEKDNTKLNSLIISLLLMTPAIMTFLSASLQMNVTQSSPLLGILICVLICKTLIDAKSIKYDLQMLAFSTALMIIYIVTATTRQEFNYSLFQLAFYAIIPIAICQQKFDIKQVIVDILLLSLPLVIVINKILAVDNVGLNQANMYNTYCFIPPVIAAITYFVFYRKNTSSLLLKMALLLNAYYLVRTLFTATRGFWLVLASYVVLLIFYRLQIKATNRKYIAILSVVAIILLVVSLNASSIISLFSDVAENTFGNGIGIVAKTKRLLGMGDILNGRSVIWGETMMNILKNPILGYGLEATKYLTSGPYLYPHNYILQLILDCGIIGLYPIYITIKAMVFFLDKNYDKIDNKISLLFLLSISIPIVSFSYDIWKYSAFWLLIGFGTTLLIGNKNHDKYKKEFRI